MTKLIALPTYCKEGGAVRVVIETPRGSLVKLALDEESGAITYERPLPLGLAYPYDWGFVPSTRAADGDPLDAMILSNAPTYPGVVIPARVLGVVEIEETSEDGKRQRNDRVIAAPLRAPASEAYAHEEKLPRALIKELEEFFKAAVIFEGKELKVLGWGEKKAAEELIDRSRLKK